MDKDLYQRIRAIFHEVCELEESERAERLDTLCAQEPETRDAVARLLDSMRDDDEEDASITQIQYAHAFPELDGYRVIALLGEGGMGAVYEADQLNPSRRVAIKVLRSRYATRAMLKRFQREAEVLARLNHPGIAQIYEVGLGNPDSGRVPFLAMELVRGSTLLHAADNSGMTVHDRLELACSLCEAVDHAHARGVIHRDLKPSNILVTENGNPKILDFGIARITERDLQAVTMQTEVGQILGTAAYMSPEQASGDPDEIDTRSDVYALGAVIYELLTGRLPHDVSNLPLPDALQSIRLNDPTSVATIDTRFRGDINTILNKALERDKDRRYQSAAELGTDIRRHLESKPIVARPPSVMYLIQKFAKRNKGFVTGLSTIFLLLVVGIIVLSFAFQRESRARVQAEQTLAKANGAYSFLEQILLGLSPRETQSMDTELLRTMLDHANDEVEQIEFPAVRAEMLVIIGRVYDSIFEYELAASVLSDAVALYESMPPSDPDVMLDTLDILSHAYHKSSEFDKASALMDRIISNARESDDRLRLSSTLRKRAEVAMDVGDYDTALALIEESRADETGITETDRARSEMQHAAILRRLDRLDEAEPLYLSALERFRSAGAELEVPIVLNSLAVLARRRGALDDAEAYYLESISVRESIDSRMNPDIAATLANLGRLFVMQSRHDEAASVLQESLDQHIQLFGEQHLNNAYPLVSLAQAQRELMCAPEALATIDHAIDIIKREVGGTHPLMITALLERIEIQTQIGDFPSALQSAERVLSMLDPASALHSEIEVTISDLRSRTSAAPEHE